MIKNAATKSIAHGPLVAMYTKFAAQCATVNQLNRLHILLENRMTPAEVYSLAAALKLGLFGPLTARPHLVRFPFYRIRRLILALPRIRKMWPLIRRIHSDDWIRGLYKRVAILHEGRPGNSSQRSEARGSYFWFRRNRVTANTLLVCFPGNQNRMLIQTPILIEALSPLQVDVLLLGSGKEEHSGEGLRGFGSTFASASQSLSRWISSKGYQEVWTFGTSRGALPAIVYGLELKATRIVSVGPSRVKKLSPSHTRRIFRQGKSSSAQIRLVFGEHAPYDGRNAFALRELLAQSEICAIPDAPHAPIWDLMLRGELQMFLESMFSGEQLSNPVGYPFMQVVPPTTLSYEDFVMATTRGASRR